MLGGETRPVLLGQLAAIADTDQHIMRHRHLAAVKAAVIGGDQRQTGGQRQIQKDRLGALFAGKTMTLKFDIDTARQSGLQRGETLGYQRGLSLGGGGTDKSIQRTAGKTDQPLLIRDQIIKCDDRVIAALDLKQRL